jgi:uncharacterized protein YciI
MAGKNFRTKITRAGVATLILLSFACLYPSMAAAQEQAEPQYDEALAKQLGADERGMRSYVLVVLKTGPTRVPDGEKRTEMFAGHMANMQRLANEGVLVFAGPLDGVDGWRGVFVFATAEIEEAKTYVSTDPVIINGEMVAEYHQLYGSAGLMMMNEISQKIRKQ